MTRTILVCLIAIFAAACDGGGGVTVSNGSDGDGSGSGSGAPMTDAKVSAALMAGIVLPPGTYTLDDPKTDDTVTVSPPDASGGMAAGGDVHPGDVITVEIPFEAPMGNVVGAGIRFGDSGPVHVIPVDMAEGQKTGKLAFQFQVPDGICSMLGNICHEIVCSEFAVTSAGTISRANVTQLAMACNNCSEPNCAGLLQMCMMQTCTEDGGCEPMPEPDPDPQGKACTVDLSKDPVEVIDIPCVAACDAQWFACGDACDCGDGCDAGECIVGCDDANAACVDACLACAAPCDSEINACWLASCGDGTSEESCLCNQQCLDDAVGCYAGCK